jgi:hypothetical protein
LDWIKKLKEYAPDIVTAVLTGGATLPQLALKAVADATGNEVNTQDDLQRAVESATPEMMLKITQANNQFKIRIRELDNDLVATELGDTQDARKSHKHSNMPAVITIMLTVIVSGLLYTITQTEVIGGNRDLAMMMFGNVFTLWGASITYWVGTTRSSANKDRK